VITQGRRVQGKVTTYDIEKWRGVHVRRAGRKFFPGMKDLEHGFGASSYRVYGSTGNMLEKVSSGEHLLGYNVSVPTHGPRQEGPCAGRRPAQGLRSCCRAYSSSASRRRTQCEA
jgi:hypothetical protein